MDVMLREGYRITFCMKLITVISTIVTTVSSIALFINWYRNRLLPRIRQLLLECLKFRRYNFFNFSSSYLILKFKIFQKLKFSKFLILKKFEIFSNLLDFWFYEIFSFLKFRRNLENFKLKPLELPVNTHYFIFWLIKNFRIFFNPYLFIFVFQN